ncbi:protein of unknown function [Xenorhabdus bovienii]|uniref:Uncharacterized protein n=1 Tax=Xenorhabdus bovienii TaxID=40576 RepID=A0A0B6X8C2_XENBV|nr:protein of unknown function [Xenorhabdus bovienii]
MRERAKLMAEEFSHLADFLITPHNPDIIRNQSDGSLIVVPAIGYWVR